MRLCVFPGGIPPPIYFGALIDRTCLKWGTKQCGGRGACRIYDANAFRYSETTAYFAILHVFVEELCFVDNLSNLFLFAVLPGGYSWASSLDFTS